MYLIENNTNSSYWNDLSHLCVQGEGYILDILTQMLDEGAELEMYDINYRSKCWCFDQNLVFLNMLSI